MDDAQAASSSSSSSWIVGLFIALTEAAEDLDTALGEWLLHGALAGFTHDVPPGPYFPQTQEPPGMTLEEVVAATHNHPSSLGNHGEATPPGL